MQKIELTDQQKDFARYVGHEVTLLAGGIGINLGLYFPEIYTDDGILKPNGVNVFFPKANKVYVQNFNQVELIFPEGEPGGETEANPYMKQLKEKYDAICNIPSTKHTSCCLQKANDDEPIFVLLARDLTAPETIAKWVALNIGIQPFEKLYSALKTAEQMMDWKVSQEAK